MDLIPKVLLHIYYLIPDTTSFLTEHGSFKSFLHIFAIFRTNISK